MVMQISDSKMNADTAYGMTIEHESLLYHRLGNSEDQHIIRLKSSLSRMLINFIE